MSSYENLSQAGVDQLLAQVGQLLARLHVHEPSNQVVVLVHACAEWDACSQTVHVFLQIRTADRALRVLRTALREPSGS